MKTLEELAKIREAALAKEGASGAIENQPKMIITIGMATCGITAGARPVLTALLESMVEDANETVKIMQTGCFGKCQEEPMAKLQTSTGECYYYGHLDDKKIVEIYRHHCVSRDALTKYLVEME